MYISSQRLSMIIQDVDKTNILARYEVNPAEITIESDLGKGQFGKVSKAKMRKIQPGKAESWVAVKMLKGTALLI